MYCKYCNCWLGALQGHPLSFFTLSLLLFLQMEKSEEFSLHSAPYSPQRLQTNLGAAAESRGTSHAIHTFPTDKPGHAPGGFQPASPLGHVSAVKSTSKPYQLPTSEVRPTVSSGLPSSHLGRDSSSQASARFERPHFGRPNGSSYTPQVKGNPCCLLAVSNRGKSVVQISFSLIGGQELSYPGDVIAQTSHVKVLLLEGCSHLTPNRFFCKCQIFFWVLRTPIGVMMIIIIGITFI